MTDNQPTADATELETEITACLNSAYLSSTHNGLDSAGDTANYLTGFAAKYFAHQQEQAVRDVVADNLMQYRDEQLAIVGDRSEKISGVIKQSFDKRIAELRGEK